MPIANLLLVVIAIVVHAFWIAAVADSDGKCHYDDCKGCPYEGTCPAEEEDERDA